MQLRLGTHVHCAGEQVGQVGDVVIDPVTRRLTHIVVETHERIHDGRPRQYHEAPTHPGYTHVATFSMVTIVSS